MAATGNAAGGGELAGGTGQTLMNLPGRIIKTVGSYLLHPIEAALVPERAQRRSFAQTFSSSFGSAGPEWESGTLKEALSRCRREGRMLLVYLHSRWNASALALCRDVLCKHELQNHLGDLRLLLWGAAVESSVGHSLVLQLGVTEYPFLCLLSHLPTESSPRLLDIIPSDGLDMTTFTAKLSSAVERNAHYIAEARRKIDEEQRRRETIAEQNRVFEEASRRDRERDRLRKEEEDRQREAEEKREEEERLQEAVDLSRQLGRERQINACRERLQNAPPTGGAEGTAAIMVRLSDGSRLIRKFSRTDVVRTVHDWVSVELFDRGSDVTNFVLVSNHPMRIFAPDTPDAGLSLNDAGLSPQGSLFIRDEDA